MRLSCFVCPSVFGNVDQLCKHVKNVHKIRGEDNYQCKMCTVILGDMNSFKRHVTRCVSKTKNVGAKRTDHVCVK